MKKKIFTYSLLIIFMTCSLVYAEEQDLSKTVALQLLTRKIQNNSFPEGILNKDAFQLLYESQGNDCSKAVRTFAQTINENFADIQSIEDREDTLALLDDLACIDPYAVRDGIQFVFSDQYHTLDEYSKQLATVLGEERAQELLQQLHALADQLRVNGKNKIVVINATFASGGVAEMFRTMGNILRQVGIEIEWHMIRSADQAYSEVTRKVFDVLQGSDQLFERAELRIWRNENLRMVDMLKSIAMDEQVGAIFIEDHQPVHLVKAFKMINPHKCVIWRFHDDTRGIKQNMQGALQVWHELLDNICSLDQDDYALFQPHSMLSAMPNAVCHVAEQPPGIDPLAEKNKRISWKQAQQILPAMNVDNIVATPINPDKPYLITGGRFVSWKGQMIVLRVFEMLAKEFDDLHLCIFGIVSSNDPRKVRYHKLIQTYIKILEEKNPTFKGKISLIINETDNIRALYRLARKHTLPFCACSIAEGWNLMADEASMQGAVPFSTDAGGLARFGLTVHNKRCHAVINDLVNDITNPEKLYYIDEKTGSVIVSQQALKLEQRIYHTLSALLRYKKTDPAQYAKWYKAANHEAKVMAYNTCLIPMSIHYLSMATGSNLPY